MTDLRFEDSAVRPAAGSSIRSGKFRPMFKWWFWLLAIDFVVLMWVGGQVPTNFTSWVSLIAATYWFAYFLVVLPVLGLTETPLPQPESISAPVLSHPANAPAGAAASPEKRG